MLLLLPVPNDANSTDPTCASDTYTRPLGWKLDLFDIDHVWSAAALNVVQSVLPVKLGDRTIYEN